MSVRSSLSVSTVVIPELVSDRRERVRGFMEEHVYPNEPTLFREDETADALIRELQQGEVRRPVGAAPSAGGGRQR